MAHKGLSPETVVKAAAELIEQQGRETFSMRALADHLGVKTASLYNHVDHMEGLLAEVCRFRQWQLVQIWHLYPCIKAAEA